ncbi:hypothetical protein IAW_06080 [Bacillus cereus str. Schrouff]|nr:hypothetical protein IAW_06080 [Bacillus cereus str. Schrouff]EOO81579.1 hypothetical protein IGY_05805 [Bacillus cereus K-5975c]
MILANLGLNQIILISVPILTTIYPLTIVLIILSFFHKYFKGYSSVYVGSLTGTALINIVDSLKQSEIEMNFIENLYDFIPLYEAGLGWVLPAICGAFIGYLWGSLKDDYSYQNKYDIKSKINN